MVQGYRTVLTFKHVDCNKQNIKQALIQNFIQTLKTNISVQKRRQDSAQVENTPQINLVIPRNDKINDCMQYDENCIPCMNIDCKWVTHQRLFYKSRKIFRLPANSENGHCELCSRPNINFSKLSLISSKKVFFLD
jgi:hypothetical protein